MMLPSSRPQLLLRAARVSVEEVRLNVPNEVEWENAAWTSDLQQHSSLPRHYSHRPGRRCLKQQSALFTSGVLTTTST
jgi:hypothetical protein